MEFMNDVHGLARPALRRVAIFFIGIVTAVGLLAAVGTMTGSERGLRAGGSGDSVVKLAGGSPTRHWGTPVKPKQYKSGGSIGG